MNLAALIAGAALIACGGGGDATPGDGGPSLSSPGSLWILGERTPLRWSGSVWEPATKGLPVSEGSATFATILDVWPASPTEAWAVAQAHDATSGTYISAVLTWNGDAWSKQAILPMTRMSSVWGTSSMDVWVAGDDGSDTGASARLSHWNGAAWTEVQGGIETEPGAVAGLWGRSGTEVYLALIDRIQRYDGMSVTTDYHQTDLTCRGFWGTSSVHIWTICRDIGRNRPAILERQGPQTWQATPASTALTFEAIHGRSASDVWIVGNASQKPGILHWDGMAWAPLAPPDGLAVPIHDVFAAPDAVWIVGDAGTVLRCDAAAWTPVPSGTAERLLKIRGLQ